MLKESKPRERNWGVPNEGIADHSTEAGSMEYRPGSLSWKDETRGSAPGVCPFPRA